VAPKSPWSTSREIYIDDMTEVCVLKRKKHELEQTATTLQRAVAGRVIRLNKDLRIADIWDGEKPGRALKKAGFFNGMDLRKATALAETKVNGKNLWDQLKVCARTGREFGAEPCHYAGRPDKTPDLFAPGALSISIKPIADLDDNVTSLLMVVKSAEPRRVYHEKKAESLDRLEHILAAAAKGFLLKDVVKETCDPLTCLLARLDLLRHKLALERQTWKAPHAQEIPYYLGEIQKLEGLVVNLSEHFKSMLENTCYFQSLGVSPFDVNQTLLKTIAILKSCGALDGCGVTLKPPSSVIPMVEACEQEFIMIFVVLFLLSRTCLKNVSERAIECETVTNKKHVIARISHNGFIHSRKYLDIIFDSDPLSHYFFATDSVCAMDTLLYYAALLLKKNKTKTRITNIPGQFSLSLVTPLRPH